MIPCRPGALRRQMRYRYQNSRRTLSGNLCSRVLSTSMEPFGKSFHGSFWKDPSTEASSGKQWLDGHRPFEPELQENDSRPRPALDLRTAIENNSRRRGSTHEQSNFWRVWESTFLGWEAPLGFLRLPQVMPTSMLIPISFLKFMDLSLCATSD